jgi:hypothetical protein
MVQVKVLEMSPNVLVFVFYNPISTRIYEFPTFMQHKEYIKTEDEDNSFVVNSKDGSEFHVAPIINYSVQREKVPFILENIVEH